MVDIESELIKIDTNISDSSEKEKEITEKLEILRIETQQLKQILFKDPITDVHDLVT